MLNNKIKVLQVISTMNYGGAETMIMNIYRNIDKEKFDFDFVCTEKNKFDYEDEINNLGGNIYRIEAVLKSGIVKYIKSIYKIIKEHKYDVIHTHSMFFSGIICMIAYFAGIKVRIAHSHSTNDPKSQKTNRKLYILMCKVCIRMFVNRKLSCGKMASEFLYGKNKNITIIHNGIDLKRYEIVTDNDIIKLKEEFKINKDDLIIGTVGRFEKVKNQEYFIDLAKEFIKRGIKVKIVLVGNGSLFEKIKNKINEENLQKYFILTGTRKDIPSLMKMFDIFLLPSLYEGFPIVIVEALAANNICFISKNVSEEVNIIPEKINFFDIADSKEKVCESILNKLKENNNINTIDILNKEGFSVNGMTRQIEDVYMSGKQEGEI